MRWWHLLAVAVTMPTSLAWGTEAAVDKGGAFIWENTRGIRAPGSKLKSVDGLEFTGYTLKPPQSPGWKVLRQGPHPRGFGLAKRGQDRISLVWAGSFLLALDSSIDGIVRGLVGQPHWGEEDQFRVLAAAGTEVRRGTVRCVRVTSTAKMESGRRGSGTDTEFKADGLSCTHPTAPTLQVVLGYVERKSVSAAWTTTQDEAEQFFDSLQFRELSTPIEDNLALPGPPFALASLDGALWVGLGNEGVVLRVDPDTGVIVESIELPGPAKSLMAFEGSLWVVTSRDRALFRISPETNQVVAEIEVPARCRKVVSGAGSCWAVCGMDHLVRIDPKTNTVQSTIKGPWLGKKQALNPLPPVLTGLAYAEPWLWVVDGEHSRVFRVDPATNQIHRGAIKVGKRPVEIVATESSVWTVNRLDESLSQIDRQSGRVVGEVAVKWEPVFAVAHNGILWISNSYHHAITRIDTTRSVPQVLPIGAGLRPVGLTISGDYLWVADGLGDTLHKVRLAGY